MASHDGIGQNEYSPSAPEAWIDIGDFEVWYLFMQNTHEIREVTRKDKRGWEGTDPKLWSYNRLLRILGAPELDESRRHEQVLGGK